MGASAGKPIEHEHFGFAPRKSATHEPQPPAEDPGSYVDSWYQVLKANGEGEDTELAEDLD